MTIPNFQAGQILTADGLNSALEDTASQALSDAQSNPNVFTEPQTFEGAITQIAGAGANNQTPFAQYGDFLSDFIVDGLSVAVPSPASLTTTLSTGTAVVLGQRTVVDSIPNATNTYAASSDTYVSLSRSGVVAYAAVANGATAPVPDSGAVNILKVVTSSAAITSVVPLVSISGISDGDGSLVGYNQGSSGSVQRTLQSRLQDSVCVLDFGADPTGTNDSTQAIQDAISSGANTIFFPDGVYVCSGQIEIFSGISLCGSKKSVSTSASPFPKYGATIVGTGSGEGFIYSNPSNNALTQSVSMVNLTIITGSSSTYDWAVHLINPEDSFFQNIGVSAYNSGGGMKLTKSELSVPAWIIKISDSNFSAVTGNSFYNECTDSMFTGIYCSGGGAGAVESGGDNSYCNCMFDNSTNNLTVLANAAQNPNAGVVNIIGCKFQNAGSSSIYFNGGTTGLFNFGSVVSGCNFNNTSPTTGDIVLQNASYITLTGNNHSLSGSTHPNIAVQGDYSASDITVTGCLIPGGRSGPFNNTCILNNNIGLGDIPPTQTSDVGSSAFSLTVDSPFYGTQAIIGTGGIPTSITINLNFTPTSEQHGLKLEFCYVTASPTTAVPLTVASSTSQTIFNAPTDTPINQKFCLVWSATNSFWYFLQ